MPPCRFGWVGHGRGVRVAPGPFPVPAAEPDVRVSTHPALHVSCPLLSRCWRWRVGAENTDTSRDLQIFVYQACGCPKTLRTSCDLLIFVEEAADAVVSLDLADVGWRAVG